MPNENPPYHLIVVIKHSVELLLALLVIGWLHKFGVVYMPNAVYMLSGEDLIS